MLQEPEGPYVMGGWIGARRQRRLIDAVLAERSVRMVFQPIVDGATMRQVGAEALARFARPDYPGPEQWFAAALAVGRGLPLQLLATEAALADAVKLPEDCYVAINVGPEALMSSELVPMLLSSAVAADRLVVELTEHTKISDYTPMRRARQGLADHGIRFSVDDVGAGYASLRHVLALQPDMAKLDRDLIIGFEHDKARQALVMAALTFAHSQDFILVAEGVETPGEARVLAELGMDQLQGNAIGRPAPIDGPPE